MNPGDLSVSVLDCSSSSFIVYQYFIDSIFQSQEVLQPDSCCPGSKGEAPITILQKGEMDSITIDHGHDLSAYFSFSSLLMSAADCLFSRHCLCICSQEDASLAVPSAITRRPSFSSSLLEAGKEQKRSGPSLNKVLQAAHIVENWSNTGAFRVLFCDENPVQDACRLRVIERCKVWTWSRG